MQGPLGFYDLPELLFLFFGEKANAIIIFAAMGDTSLRAISRSIVRRLTPIICAASCLVIVIGLRSICRRLPPRQFSKCMRSNEIHRLGPGIQTYKTGIINPNSVKSVKLEARPV